MAAYDQQKLVIKHLPSTLLDHEKYDFIAHFGATEVKFLNSKFKKTSTCIARFPSEELAQAVLTSLHQYELFGSKLTVEFARGSDLSQRLDSIKKPSEEETKEEKSTKRKLLDNYLHKLNSWLGGLELGQPPPSHLKYHYPQPSRPVLLNVAKAMFTNTKFYTQVLHLMNKLNLPCPFSEPFPIDCDLFSNVPQPSDTLLSSDESEMEPDDQEPSIKEIISKKRKKSSVPKIKRPKLIKIVPTKEKTVAVNPKEIFETVEIVSKKIEVNVKSDLEGLKDLKRSQRIEGQTFEKTGEVVVSEADKSEEAEQKLESSEPTITSEQLAANRISYRDQKLLPVFKNYVPGLPSCRLYIKNLAKGVTEKDLHRIYRRYISVENDADSDSPAMFDIRLLQEGRMKGQAFVTLGSTTQAQTALNETNGFILKDKPMMVQFARSAKAPPPAKPSPS